VAVVQGHLQVYAVQTKITLKHQGCGASYTALYRVQKGNPPFDFELI
jgi:hypothetical protein